VSTQVSEAGGGMYCFIEKNEDVGPAFASCLGGLMSVVARSAMLGCAVP
jgi:hypothetical protein